MQDDWLCTPSFTRAQGMVLVDGLHLSPALTMPHTKAGNVGDCHGVLITIFLSIGSWLVGKYLRQNFRVKMALLRKTSHGGLY